MKVVNNSTVTYIDHMGSDLTIVNAARVSFDKESDWETYSDEFELPARDEKLIRYLAQHNHWSPFAHTSIQIRVDAPVFVARQLVKHQVGGVWNEVSRRYVDDEPSFYLPEVWRKRAENKKQGSSSEGIDLGLVRLVDNFGSIIDDYYLDEGLIEYHEEALRIYNKMLTADVAPEQARMILPQNMMTSWYWTGSLMFFHRVYKQRIDSHAQQETQEVAKQIGEICDALFPVAWRELNG